MNNIYLNQDYDLNIDDFSNSYINIFNDWQNKIIKDTFTILGEDFKIWGVLDISFYAVLRNDSLDGKQVNVFSLNLCPHHIFFNSNSYSILLEFPLTKDINITESISNAFQKYFSSISTPANLDLNYGVLQIDKINFIHSVFSSLSVLLNEDTIFKNLKTSVLWNIYTKNLNDFSIYGFYISFGINDVSVPYIDLRSDYMSITIFPSIIKIVYSNIHNKFGVYLKEFTYIFSPEQHFSLDLFIQEKILLSYNELYQNDFTDLIDLFKVLEMENY